MTFTAHEGEGDMVDVIIDAASKRVFERTRGKVVRSMHRWERYLEGIDEPVEIFGKG
jgi:biotin synthase